MHVHTMLSESRAESAPVTVVVRVLGLPQMHSTARSPRGAWQLWNLAWRVEG